MVLAQSTGHYPAPQRPNSARVTGLSLAIALNASVLLAASVLMKPPLFLQPASATITVVDLPRDATPTPPPPPERVPVVRTQRVPVPQPVPTPQREPAPDARAQPLATGPAFDPAPASFVVPETGGVPDPGPAAPPVAGVRLQYEAAPPPRYTADLIRDRAQGTVLLQVLVDVDGRPLQVTIHRSSGNRRLDRLAQQHVQARWSFQPATRDGRAVQAIGLVPIDFRLD
jgi:protein TonB